MPAKRYRVDLTQDEREQSLDITRRGKSTARKVKRSLVPCKADEGATDQQIADALLVGPSTVSRVRQRKLDGKQEAHLVAVACSTAPDGHLQSITRVESTRLISPGTS